MTNIFEQFREQCARVIEQTRHYSSSPKRIFDISQDARNEQAKVIRALPVLEVKQEPFGWVQYAYGIRTTNFARNASELKTMKEIAATLGKGMMFEYIPVFILPPDAEALRAENAKLQQTLRFVERCANHHGRNPNISAAEVLSMIQHYPAIEDITKSYADGVVPDTRNPYAELAALQAECKAIEANYEAARELLADVLKDGSCQIAHRINVFLNGWKEGRL